jgi:hypothetical protein
MHVFQVWKFVPSNMFTILSTFILAIGIVCLTTYCYDTMWNIKGKKHYTQFKKYKVYFLSSLPIHETQLKYLPHVFLPPNTLNTSEGL